MKWFTINITFICGMIFWSNVSFSQEKKFQLVGTVKGIDTGVIKINTWLVDSTKPSSFTSYISKGKFIVSGKISHPMKVYLVLNKSLYTEDFFIEPGSQNIYFDATNKNSFYQSMNITGSAVNAEYLNKYQKPLTPFYDSLDSCYLILDSLNKLSREEKHSYIFTELCNQIEFIKSKIDSAKRIFIIKHSSSFVSLWSLYTSISFLENLDFVTECFKYLDNRLLNSVVGQQLAQRIREEKVFLNGKIFPAMLVADSGEKKVAIQEIIKGKYTLIDFWFSTCGPCIVQFPVIRDLYTKYNSIGFDVISISIDKSVKKKDWIGAIAKHELNWRQYWDVDSKEASRLYIDSFPTNFLLDSNGKIIKKNVLLEELYILLEKNLQ